MLQLQAGESFPIVRQLKDPTETGTNYVQAVIRNARTDIIIATVNLTDQGDQRFIGAWQVIDDPSGQGLYITIITKVYTDAGYTTLNNNYLIESNDYLIAQRWGLQFGGGGGGSDINYKKIRAMMEEVIRQEKEDLSYLRLTPEVILSAIRPLISNIDGKIGKIRIPEPEKLDIAPAIQAVATLGKVVETLGKRLDDMGKRFDVSDKGFVELSKLHNRLTATVADSHKGTSKELDKIFDKVRDYLNKDMENYGNSVKDISSKIDKIKLAVVSGLGDEEKTEKKEKKEKEEAPKRDFTRLIRGFSLK